MIAFSALLALGAVACGDDAEAPAGGAEVEGEGGEEEGGLDY